VNLKLILPNAHAFSRFVDKLPMELLVHDAPQQPIVFPCPPIRVLLVEDDPDAAELVFTRLASEGGQEFSIDWSPNLHHAVRRLARPDIDVVLLDLGLPELSGYQSYLHIEAVTGRLLPVIILTADQRTLSENLTLALGAVAYLRKDQVSTLQLRRTIRDAVRGVL
jgi:DNA-binding response OmpR family regulator